MRKKITSTIVILMLICMATLGCFSVPIGFTLCSLIGLIYGMKYRDRAYIKYAIAGLILGLLSWLYTLTIIFSM